MSFVNQYTIFYLPIAAVFFLVGMLVMRWELTKPKKPIALAGHTKEELETETFLSTLADDTQDDHRLRRYQFSRPEVLAITDKPHSTITSMANIQRYLRVRSSADTKPATIRATARVQT